VCYIHIYIILIYLSGLIIIIIIIIMSTNTQGTQTAIILMVSTFSSIRSLIYHSLKVKFSLEQTTKTSKSSRVLYRWSLPVVFGALVFKLSVWCGAEGYVLLMMGMVVPETCWASNKICNKNHLLYLVGILFPRTKLSHIINIVCFLHIPTMLVAIHTSLRMTTNIVETCSRHTIFIV
jgi:hypothetical protein